MYDHSSLAKELFKKGYNCSQSVFASFCDETGLDIETALKISSSFGGGMGRLREVCGAVTGMFMVVGLKYGYADPNDKALKTEHYKLIQYLAKKFKEDNTFIICRDLLSLNNPNINVSDNYIPSDRTESYYKERDCVDLVVSAANILDEYIKNKHME